MGRKKIEFTTEQDVRIKQLVNEGYSLNGILSKINDEFSTTFSRSCIDRRIKTLGIIRSKINEKVKQAISRSDVIKYIINKYYYNNCKYWSEYRFRTQYTLNEFAKRMGVSKPTVLKYLNKYNLPTQITPEMKEFSDISNLDLRMFKKETVDAIVEYLKNKTNVVIETNAIIKVGNTDVTVELLFPEYNTVLLCGMKDDYYTKKVGETEIPIQCMFKWYEKIENETNYKYVCYRLEYNKVRKCQTKYNIQYVCDSIIKDLGLQLKDL